MHVLHIAKFLALRITKKTKIFVSEIYFEVYNAINILAFYVWWLFENIILLKEQETKVTLQSYKIVHQTKQSPKLKYIS